MNHHPPSPVGRVAHGRAGCAAVHPDHPARRQPLAAAGALGPVRCRPGRVVRRHPSERGRLLAGGRRRVVLPWTSRAVILVVAAYLWRRRARLLTVWLLVRPARSWAWSRRSSTSSIGRGRPGCWSRTTGWSYVSGHATAAFVMAGALGVVLPSVRGWRRRFRLLVMLPTIAVRLDRVGRPDRAERALRVRRDRRLGARAGDPDRHVDRVRASAGPASTASAYPFGRRRYVGPAAGRRDREPDQGRRRRWRSGGR